MRALIIVAIAAIAGCAEPADAPFDTPVIFVGQLESETLIPQSRSNECNLTADDVASGAICISNGCGTGEATFLIDRVLAGTFGDRRGVLRYGIGEWCQPEFFNARQPLLVCVYEKKDGEHRFRSEPIYKTDEGDVILLHEIKRIGEIEVASLLRPLRTAIPYATVSELSGYGLEDLLAEGRVIADGETVSAVRGVFLEDLAERLSESGTAAWTATQNGTRLPAPKIAAAHHADTP